MPKLKSGVARNRLRLEQSTQTASAGGVGNLLSKATDTVVGFMEENTRDKTRGRIADLKEVAKQQGEEFKTLSNMPSAEKRRKAKEFYEGRIKENNGVQGIVKGVNKEIDLRKLDAERDDIYKFAMEQGESEEDALAKIIRSEEELLAVLDNSVYSDEDKDEILAKYKAQGQAKAPIYQGVWNMAKTGFTRDQLYNVTGAIKANTNLFEIEEMTKMTRVLVEAGIETGTITDAEASTIMASTGDNNLNKVLEDVRDSNLSDEEKSEQYRMILEGIENRNPDMFLGLGYEPFSYGRASTTFNNFKAKVDNQVAVTAQDERKLAHKKKTNYTEVWRGQGNQFNGDFRTTRKYEFDYIEENMQSEVLTEYVNNPNDTMANLYINNQIQGFSYLSENDKEGFTNYVADINTPLDMIHNFQGQESKKYLGDVPYDSIQFEMFHDEAFNLGGMSNEMYKSVEMGEDRNAGEVSQRIMSGRRMTSGAVGRLDAFTLLEATKNSQRGSIEILDTIDTFNALKDEPGFGRMSNRFQEDLADLIVYHMTKTTSLSDEGIASQTREFILGEASPTDALLQGGLVTDQFFAIIESEDFSEDIDTLLGSYTEGKTVTIDERTMEPLVIDIPDLEQDDIDKTRITDYEDNELFYQDIETGKFIPVTEDMANAMVVDVNNKNYGYQLEGGIAYEKNASDGGFIPFNRDVQSFLRVAEDLDAQPSTISKVIEAGKKFIKSTNQDRMYRRLPEDKKVVGNYLLPSDGTKTQKGDEEYSRVGNYMIKNKQKSIIPTKNDLIQSPVAMASEIIDSTKQINAFDEPRVNTMYGKSMRNDIKMEGARPKRYKSSEGGYDTIGIGHKMSKAEHEGNYVMLNGEKRNLKKPLSQKEVEQLHLQDFRKHYTVMENTLENNNIDIRTLDTPMLEAINRTVFNTGKIWKGMIEGLQNGDMNRFNRSLLSVVGSTEKGEKIVFPGLALDRAISYNMVNDVPVNYVKFENTKSGTKWIYYDADDNQVTEPFYSSRKLSSKSKEGKKYLVSSREW